VSNAQVMNRHGRQFWGHDHPTF